ncbi:hypothetical protein DX933_12655 [Ornithinibacillus gellani]|uniref:hypothetical protein n=1 Tax=Ornithinibacillus gellani TaxID=2293253 RepID=UPI000F4963BF|nr:hypothetical protein [Ornithinibacillus gellani]TQS74171.1 hypothetical protein DX933_12655 [Ornithinibacillus gellani]
MSWIASQPYVKVERKVTSIEQTDEEDKRCLYLYPDRVKSKHREFSIDAVTDISFRKVGDKGGMLYLHTNRGVFSYIVKESPADFIAVFHEHVQQLKKE